MLENTCCNNSNMKGEKETSESIPALAFPVVIKLFPDHADHNLITDETTCVHDLLGFLAEGGLLGDLRS